MTLGFCDALLMRDVLLEIAIIHKKIHKVVPLRISGEEESCAEVAILKISHDGICGLGEVVPFSFYDIDNSWDALAKWLAKLEDFKNFSPLQRYRIEEKLLQLNAPMAVRAGVDMALHDWLGKAAGLPLFDLFGLRGMLYPDTSLTIGIGSPKKSVGRMRSWRKLGKTRLWKIKLGSSEGLDADKKMFAALAKQVEGTSSKMYVDANGGWTKNEALHMGNWLKNFGVLFIEQPLARGEEKMLAEAQ